MTLLVGHVKY